MTKLTFRPLWAVLLLSLTFLHRAQAQRGGSGGELYESGVLSGSIHTFSSGGSESTFASGLQSPVGMAFDSSGDLFVADNDVIYEYTPDGARTVFASGAGAFCLAFDAYGNLFADSGNTIVEITPSGDMSTFATGLDHPTALAFNSAGDLFEADDGSGNINEFTPDGTETAFASGLDGPFDIAFNHSGDLFETNYFGGSIMEFAPDGAESTFATGLQNAYGLAFDSSGDLFETNYNGAGQFNIMEYTPQGSVSTFATTSDSGYLAFTPVPEPSTWAMLLVGFLGVALLTRSMKPPPVAAKKS